MWIFRINPCEQTTHQKLNQGTTLTYIKLIMVARISAQNYAT
jgi:hypothetical protein